MQGWPLLERKQLQLKKVVSPTQLVPKAGSEPQRAEVRPSSEPALTPRPNIKIKGASISATETSRKGCGLLSLTWLGNLEATLPGSACVTALHTIHLGMWLC